MLLRFPESRNTRVRFAVKQCCLDLKKNKLTRPKIPLKNVSPCKSNTKNVNANPQKYGSDALNKILFQLKR